jgi:hypothetical protein
MRRFSFIFYLLLLATFLMTTGDVLANTSDDKAFVDEIIGASGVTWIPKVAFGQMVLTISRPDGSVFNKVFTSGTTPYLDLSSIYGDSPGDGLYTYELRISPVAGPKIRKSMERAGLDQEKRMNLDTLSQTGHFQIQGGVIVTGGPPEELSGAKDVLHYDDVIITGSLCVGFDCQDGENFGFDTIILKEHNLRILFNDTSYTASYPTNSWRITINDSTNGGASYFSVDDVDDGTSIFKIEAGAPSNSLYVEDYGRIGLGTSTPVVELHIKDSDTPTVRLEQDSSGGWTAQTYDVAGNESNFFIRDATNGSKLPFRIQPSAPSSTLCLKSNGYIGFGTWSPGWPLELETTGENAAFVCDRTDGATNFISATGSYGQFGTVSNHGVRILANSAWVMRINTDGTLDMSDGGSYDGAWNPASSKELKENIKNLSVEEATAAVNGLNPVKYNYKKNKKEEHVGFIAEEVPDLLAMNGRKSLSTLDIVAVLTKVVQQQQEFIREQQKINAKLKKEITQLKKK